MAKDVTFKINIEENGKIKKVTADAEGLGKALNGVKESAEKINTGALNFAQLASSLDSVQNTISQLQGAMSGAVAAFNKQEVAMTKLQTVMRNTMDATDAEIKSIYDLTAAQQKLGVIGDEVQLAGAQELSTYLSKTETLKKLIPVMNDMVAQQYGLEASQESAAQIATMLGKVMEGQTGALSRYGYSFTEAQEQILKFGTEEERAATLADVIAESVGGVNEELAKTNSGKLQQINNNLGDFAEKLGKAATVAMPFVTIASQAAMAGANVAKLVAGFKALIAAKTGIIATSKAVVSLNASILLTGKSSTSTVAAMRRLIAATGSATAATKALRLAKLGLAGVLVGALALGISHIVKKQKEAKAAAEELAQAQSDIRSSVAASRAELELEILKLANFNGTAEEASQIVGELNEKYGDKLGMQDSISAWYENLSGKIDTYCTKLAREAKLQKLINDIATKKTEKSELEEKLANTPQTVKQSYGNGYTTWEIENPQINLLVSQIAEVDASIAESSKKAEELIQEIGSITDELTQDITTTSTKASEEVDKIEEAIKSFREAVKNAVSVNQAFGDSIDDQTAELDAMRSGIVSLIKNYGIEDQRIKELVNDYYRLARARSASYGNLEAIAANPALIGSAQVGTPSGVTAQKEKSEGFEVPKVDKIQAASVAVRGLSSAFSSLGEIMDESAQTWLNWASNVASAIASAIEPIATLIAMISAKKAITDEDTESQAINAATTVSATSMIIGAKSAEATANTAAAVTGAASSVASIPWVGPILAVAAIASVIAALSNIPKFANGGIAYGPTLGIFGEYSGASNNPEVVAPLDKLKDLISGEGGGGAMTVKVKIGGRDLIGVGKKNLNFNKRTR